MNKNTRGWIIGLMMIVIFAGLILNQSTKTGDESRGMSLVIAHKIDSAIVHIKGEPERTVDEIELIVRKFAHFTEYLIFGSLVFLIIMKLSRYRWLGFLLTFILTVPLPFIDEWVQTRSVGRTSQVLDVGIDLSGILVALFIGVMHFASEVWDHRSHTDSLAYSSKEKLTQQYLSVIILKI